MFVFFSLIHFFYQTNYFLNLLVFELLGLCVFLFCLSLSNLRIRLVGIYFCVLVLCLGVCESVIGLALLVDCSRYIGKKQSKSFSFLGF